MLFTTITRATNATTKETEAEAAAEAVAEAEAEAAAEAALRFSSKTLWYSPFTGNFSFRTPHDVRGGFICDDMGLGKVHCDYR